MLPTVPCKRTSTWSPNIIAPCSSTRTLSSTTFRARRYRSHVLCGTRHGLLNVWRLPASFAGHPTSRVLTLLSRTSTSTTNSLKDVRCASRCCYSSETSTRPSKGKHHLAMVSAEPVRWKLPSDTRTFRGLVTPLWGPGGEPSGKKWPDCCGFVVLPESQLQWLIPRHCSIDGIRVAAPSCLVVDRPTSFQRSWPAGCTSGRIDVD